MECDNDVFQPDSPARPNISPLQIDRFIFLVPEIFSLIFILKI